MFVLKLFAALGRGDVMRHKRVPVAMPQATNVDRVELRAVFQLVETGRAHFTHSTGRSIALRPASWFRSDGIRASRIDNQITETKVVREAAAFETVSDSEFVTS